MQTTLPPTTPPAKPIASFNFRAVVPEIPAQFSGDREQVKAQFEDVMRVVEIRRAFGLRAYNCAKAETEMRLWQTHIEDLQARLSDADDLGGKDEDHPVVRRAQAQIDGHRVEMEHARESIEVWQLEARAFEALLAKGED